MKLSRTFLVCTNRYFTHNWIFKIKPSSLSKLSSNISNKEKKKKKKNPEKNANRQQQQNSIWTYEPRQRSVFSHLLHPSWHILKKCPCCWCWFDLCENSGTGKSESKIHSPKDCVGHTQRASSSLKHSKTKTSLKQVSSPWPDKIHQMLIFVPKHGKKKKKSMCTNNLYSELHTVVPIILNKVKGNIKK